MRRAALAFLVAALWPSPLAAQRDTTVCTAFRTRTAAGGAILSTSVAKVACGGSARVDTVTVTVPGPAGRRDTVYWSPQFTAGRDSVVWFGPYAWPSGASPRPAPFKLPLGPVHIIHDTVYVPPPPTPPTPPAPSGAVELPRVFLNTAMPPTPASGGVVRPVATP